MFVEYTLKAVGGLFKELGPLGLEELVDFNLD
jgi:hypothetical protein